MKKITVCVADLAFGKLFDRQGKYCPLGRLGKELGISNDVLIKLHSLSTIPMEYVPKASQDLVKKIIARLHENIVLPEGFDEEDNREEDIVEAEEIFGAEWPLEKAIIHVTDGSISKDKKANLLNYLFKDLGKIIGCEFEFVEY